MRIDHCQKQIVAQRMAVEHNYCLRSKDNQAACNRITGFFPVRKRSNTTDEGDASSSSSNSKRTKISNVNRNHLVPESSLSDEENSYPCGTGPEHVVPEVKNKPEAPVGIFGVLSRESLYALFDVIPVPQLINLSLTSNVVSNEIRNYMLTGYAHKRFRAQTTEFIDGLHPQDSIKEDPFYAWGMLLKATTIAMYASQRRAFLASFYSKNKNIENWLGWGRCFMAFCEKWAFVECEALMQVVLQCTDLGQLLSKIVLEGKKHQPKLEMEIRKRIRALFLSQIKRDIRDDGFWISIILRTQGTLALRGKLFMILFGPVKTDDNGYEVIDWEMLCNTTLESRYHCEIVLGPIAQSLEVLVNTGYLGNYAWSHHDIFHLIEAITTAPDRWILDNFGALLALHPQLVHIVLCPRVTQGYYDDAARIFHSIKSVLHQWGGDTVSGVIFDVTYAIFRSWSEDHRRRFMAAVLDTQSRLLSDLLLTEPFDRNEFQAEMAAACSISSLLVMMTMNVLS